MNDIITISAGEPISSYRVIMIIDNLAYHFDPSDTNNYNKDWGVSRNAAIVGDPVDIVIHGNLFTTLSLTDGDTYYSGLNGILTNTAPTSGLLHQIATAISPTRLFIDLKQPIQLTP